MSFQATASRSCWRSCSSRTWRAMLMRSWWRRRRTETQQDALIYWRVEMAPAQTWTASTAAIQRCRYAPPSCLSLSDAILSISLDIFERPYFGSIFAHPFEPFPRRHHAILDDAILLTSSCFLNSCALFCFFWSYEYKHESKWLIDTGVRFKLMFMFANHSVMPQYSLSLISPVEMNVCYTCP